MGFFFVVFFWSKFGREEFQPELAQNNTTEKDYGL